MQERKTRDGRSVDTDLLEGLEFCFGIEGVEDSLKVADKTQLVQPSLKLAMDQARNKNTVNKSKTALISFFKGCRVLNQKEVVGICSFMVNIKVAGEVNRTLWQELMKSFVRLKYVDQKLHTGELEILKDSFDESLCHLWAQYKAEDLFFLLRANYLFQCCFFVLMLFKPWLYFHMCVCLLMLSS